MNKLHIRMLLFVPLLTALFFSAPLLAQTPPALQLFMPSGALPTREMRVWIRRPNELSELVSTDKTGKYQFKPELVGDWDYTIVVDTDKKNFETTSYRFHLTRGITFLPIFLIPLRNATIPARLLPLTENDAHVPPAARTAYELALKEVAAGRTIAAVNEFTRALMLYPTYLRALNELGTLYLNQNRLEEAAIVFSHGYRLNSDFYLPRLNLGLVRNRQGRFGEAVTLLNELVKEQPTLGHARILLAEGLMNSKQWDEAETQLREGLKDQTLKRSLQAEAHFKLGRVLSNQERYKAATLEYEQAVALEPESAVAQLQVGAVYLQLNKLTEAEAALRKAYQIGGKRLTVAQLLLGELYFNQQKYEQALRAFELYLADAPDATNTAKVKENIEKLKTALKK